MAKHHTASNIADELKCISYQWQISSKVVAVVTDNAANIVAALRVLGWMHVPCYAHTLNLIVQSSMDADTVLSTVPKKCSDIVSYFTAAVKLLKDSIIQNCLNLENRKLIQDVQTQWTLMFNCIIEQNEAITNILCLLSKNELVSYCE